MIKKKKGKKILISVLLVLLSSVLAEAVDRAGWLAPMDTFFFDSWHQLAGKRYEPEHVLIVSVDDRMLREHQDEPLVFWGPHFAGALAVLHAAGARIIGIDYQFSVSAESWLRRLDLPENELSRTFDSPMRSQLNRAPVVLIATVAVNEAGESEILLPVIDYLFSLPNNLGDLGLANLYPDEDGVVRRFVASLFDDGREPRFTLAALLAMRAGKDVVQEFGPGLAQPRPIGYAGPPGTFPRISMGELLAAKGGPDAALKERVRGKVVIIGGEYSGSNDVHLTPYNRGLFSVRSSLMSGPELHANIVETLLTGNAPRPVPGGLRTLWLVVMTGIGALLFFRFPPLLGFVWGAGLSLANSVAVYLLFLQYWTQPVLQVPLALGFIYIGSVGFRLSREERNRAHLQKAIGPYVSSAIVDQILESGKLPDLGGQTFFVSVLFSDIRSFTTISEKLQANEVVEMLNTYLSRACEPILEQGGMVDKFIGDAIMAVFGAPIHSPDQARRAVIAALAMERTAMEFQGWLRQRFPGRGLPDFRIGIGLHTGEAVVGNIGSAKRMSYTAIGDTVNIASRLEGLCKGLGWTIVVSEETLKAAGPGLVTGRREQIRPRGRQGTLVVHELLGLDSSN